MTLLPTERTTPETNPLAYSMLLYGPTKVGKTTFAAQAEGALFLETEPGTQALSVYSVKVGDWATLLRALGELGKALESGDKRFSTVVIDTVDNAYQFCIDYCLREKLDGAQHLADISHGKGYQVVNNEFHRVLLKLAHMPIGVLLISHSKERRVETRTGSYDKTTTTLPDSARKIVLGLMDIVLLAEIQATQDKDGGVRTRRVLHTKPTPAFDAGDRTGRLPDILPLDYGAFQAAFTEAINTKPDKKKGSK